MIYRCDSLRSLATSTYRLVRRLSALRASSPANRHAPKPLPQSEQFPKIISYSKRESNSLKDQPPYTPVNPQPKTSGRGARSPEVSDTETLETTICGKTRPIRSPPRPELPFAPQLPPSQHLYPQAKTPTTRQVTPAGRSSAEIVRFAIGGGGGGNRTRVPRRPNPHIYAHSQSFILFASPSLRPAGSMSSAIPV